MIILKLLLHPEFVWMWIALLLVYIIICTAEED